MLKKPSPRDVRELVEEQIRRWVSSGKEKGEASPLEPWPLITVSREFGSRGAQIGKIAAMHLGFSFWDEEIVHAIAEQTGAQKSLLHSVDEQARSRIEDLIACSVVGAWGTVTEYVRQVTRVVRTIARHGGAVVVGRGAQFVLPSESCLRVRVTRPFQERVSGYAERHGLSVKEANQIVRRTERARHSYVKRHFHKVVSEPSYYDLFVNSGEMSLGGCAQVIIAAYRTKFGRLPAHLTDATRLGRATGAHHRQANELTHPPGEPFDLGASPIPEEPLARA